MQVFSGIKEHMRDHIDNLGLYRTLVQFVRTSALLNNGLASPAKLTEKRLDLAKSCGFVVSEPQQERLCERLSPTLL